MGLKQPNNVIMWGLSETLRTVANKSSGCVSLKPPRFDLQSGVRYALLAREES